ncbi:hypothetical protein ABW20_dc0107740 [Dactylellina cionopaga]|nr:hypothetical protein ABW20_dc0107740 [Dactylellina cionopaga]
MLQPPRLTVWSSIDDLKHLKSLLYEQNGEYDGRPRGLEIIRAWSTRGRLPHAIESTAHLTECALHDNLRQSELMVRMGYSTAICRFVNGLLDPAQKSHFAVSMYSLAQEQELPASFVDIRHAATHEALPPLGVLRTACSRALDWLCVYYWDKIDASGGAEERVEGNTGKRVDQVQIFRVQGLLDRWDTLKKGNHRRLREPAKRKEERDEANICADLGSILKESADSGLFLEILVHEHLLVMEETGSMMSIYKTTDAWQPLIQFLDSQIESFTSDLFAIILEAMQEAEDTKVDGRDEFAESETEYTYQWLEFLVSLLMKGRLAAVEYAISQSHILETKYSQACTLAKKQLMTTPQSAASSGTNKQQAPGISVMMGADKGADMDLDKELEDFEAKLKSLQTQREQWSSSKKPGEPIEQPGEYNGLGKGDTSKLVPNGRKQGASFWKVEAGWIPKPMGVV